MTVISPLCPFNVVEAAAEAGAALAEAYNRKMKDTAEACRHEGIAFLPFAMETLGGLHPGVVPTARQLAAALARCKGVEESVVTSQLFGRLSLTLMRTNAVMISTRCQDADLPQASVVGIQ